MSAEKRMGWASLFGNSSKKTKQDKKSLDLQQIVQDSSQQIDSMRETYGKNIIKAIKFYQKFLKSKKLTGEMRHNAQEAYDFFVKTLQSDVSSLMNLQYVAMKISFNISNDEVLHLFENKIITPLDRLICRQAEMIRKIHCPIQIQPLAVIKKEAIEAFNDKVTQEINNGSYMTALFMFLDNNHAIKPKQAEKFYAIAQEAAKIHPIQSDDFLEALKLRLFSEESKTTPQRIDYYVLKNNQLLKVPIFKANTTKDSLLFALFIGEAVKYSNCLIEEKLRENFNERILKEIESLVDFVDHQASQDNHLPFLRR